MRMDALPSSRDVEQRPGAGPADDHARPPPGSARCRPRTPGSCAAGCPSRAARSPGGQRPAPPCRASNPRTPPPPARLILSAPPLPPKITTTGGSRPRSRKRLLPRSPEDLHPGRHPDPRERLRCSPAAGNVTNASRVKRLAEAVDPARHGVLLVQKRRYAQRPRRDHRRRARVTPHPENRPRLAVAVLCVYMSRWP